MPQAWRVIARAGRVYTTKVVLFNQGSFEVDGSRRKRFGHRTIDFGILRYTLECCFIDTGYNGLSFEIDGIDREATLNGIEMNARSCMYTCRRETGTCKTCRQGH